LRRPHLARHFLAEKLAAVHRPRTELKPDPLGHVARRRVDGTRRADIVVIASLIRLALAIDVDVRGSDVAAGGKLARARVCGPHSERRENSFPHKLVPRLASNARNKLARREDHQIRISVCRPEARNRLDKAQAANELLAVIY